MSVFRWSYSEEKCEGDFCCGDCDYCPKKGDDQDEDDGGESE